MTVSVFDHPWVSAHLGDAFASAAWSSGAQINHMIAFERALTLALAAAGRITSGAEAAALDVMDHYAPDLDDLARGTRQDGLVVPALVRQLRALCPEPEAVHSGATSQDVIDTALSLTLKRIVPEMRARLATVIADLEALSARFSGHLIMGRTRMQAALPISASSRIEAWTAPLQRHLARLGAISPELMALQLGGPVGDRSSLEPDGDRIAAHMAATLGLSDLPPWHSCRDRIAEFGGWMAGLTGSLGKMGNDIALMAQQGIDEVVLAGGGGSSAMPHKSNPVLAEALVTQAHFTAAQTAALNTALIHEQERSGAMWSLEWMLLPPMTAATLNSLSNADDLIGRIRTLGQPAN